MTRQEYNSALKRIERDNKVAEMRYNLRMKRQERNKYKTKISTSKIMILASGLLTFGIILYACFEMHVQQDLSALYALVGIAASEAAIFRGYFEKSRIENSAGGLTYEMAMVEKRKSDAPVEDPCICE